MPPFTMGLRCIFLLKTRGHTICTFFFTSHVFRYMIRVKMTPYDHSLKLLKYTILVEGFVIESTLHKKCFLTYTVVQNSVVKYILIFFSLIIFFTDLYQPNGYVQSRAFQGVHANHGRKCYMNRAYSGASSGGMYAAPMIYQSLILVCVFPMQAL